jgi:hypothetical protein
VSNPPSSPDYPVWQPRAWLLSEQDMDDCLGVASFLYPRHHLAGAVWYNTDTIKCCAKETTFMIFSILHGDHNNHPTT